MAILLTWPFGMMKGVCMQTTGYMQFCFESIICKTTWSLLICIYIILVFSPILLALK
uniref:Uncharacterized protein n=1 Tax=Rhizophora mucronata TaxID=61149 RepID=A0A2P2NKM7_RHIMU